MSAVVVCVCLNGEYKYLIGKESIFLRDELSRDSIFPFEHATLPANLDKDAVHGYFSEIARQLGVIHNRRVQYDTPKYDPETGEASVRLRVLNIAEYKYGITKGGIEAIDNCDLKNTAIREFKEEVADIDIAPERFVLKDIGQRNIYELELTTSEYIQILEETINRHDTLYGELFGIRFLKKDEVYMKWNSLNFISRHALTICFKKQ
jgi:hypothetical protein